MQGAVSFSSTSASEPSAGCNADEVPKESPNSKGVASTPSYRRRIIFAICAVVLICVAVPTVVLKVGSRGQDQSSNQSNLSESEGPQSDGFQSENGSRSPAELLPSFRDTTASAGLNPDAPRYKLYGGPSVVDFDRDGYPDILLCYHDSTFARLFFNQGNGTFVKAQWRAFYDNHGTVATPISPFTRNIRFSLSVGGNYGKDPRPPYFFEVNSDTREVINVTDQVGIAQLGGRGRTALYADLSGGQHPEYPDVLFLNARLNNSDEQQGHHFAYESIGGSSYAQRDIAGNLSRSISSYGTVTDIENDGTMEIVLYSILSVWKISSAFTFEEITSEVLPDGLPREGSLAVAELDFDNDGDFDLYVARSKSWWHHESVFNDHLLENRNGTYVDVGEQAGVPRNTSSRGVTVGDFNNDGWIDMLVVQENEADLLLLNNGNGTFRSEVRLLEKESGTQGDHAVALDYDMDGRLDVVYGQGDHHNETGRYRLFRNTMSDGDGANNFIHVRVGNAPDQSCTPLNAVVRVTAGALSMTRRVGSPGNAIAHSYMETQHFGIGRATEADMVSVTYTNGVQLTEHAVQAGAVVQLGSLPPAARQR